MARYLKRNTISSRESNDGIPELKTFRGTTRFVLYGNDELVIEYHKLTGQRIECLDYGCPACSAGDSNIEARTIPVLTPSCERRYIRAFPSQNPSELYRQILAVQEMCLDYPTRVTLTALPEFFYKLKYEQVPDSRVEQFGEAFERYLEAFLDDPDILDLSWLTRLDAVAMKSAFDPDSAQDDPWGDEQ